MQVITHLQKSQMLDVLNRASFFDHFSTLEKESLLTNRTNFVVAKKGETVIVQGDTEDGHLYVLLNGRLQVNLDDQPIAEIHPPQVFGEVSFLTKEARTSGIVAEENSLLFRIDKSGLNGMTASMREKIKDHIIARLLERLADAREQLHRPRDPLENLLSQIG